MPKPLMEPDPHQVSSWIMEKSRPTHGLTFKPKSLNAKYTNPKTTTLMMDGELSLLTTGILHYLNPLDHETSRHHHPLSLDDEDKPEPKRSFSKPTDPSHALIHWSFCRSYDCPYHRGHQSWHC